MSEWIKIESGLQSPKFDSEGVFLSNCYHSTIFMRKSILPPGFLINSVKINGVEVYVEKKG